MVKPKYKVYFKLLNFDIKVPFIRYKYGIHAKMKYTRCQRAVNPSQWGRIGTSPSFQQMEHCLPVPPASHPSCNNTVCALWGTRILKWPFILKGFLGVPLQVLLKPYDCFPCLPVGMTGFGTWVGKEREVCYIYLKNIIPPWSEFFTMRVWMVELLYFWLNLD